ncbi:glutamyl-tRNA synthetase /glutamate--tRNA(Gln) ligase [Methylomagnum ishizawai]|uniref:Glutamate--tRNA ligase n=1 Tax=Methylomagnum ishizawai TaxID=1760988 RepID=A0A1Y6CW56_9GAMM|nr:glutamate--tRNA ligase [Methylomagnum ishizawai]SMF94506.1 glutamyl-tRNA synthetase /glutamate--tRNA(Gln) ligase [Methylomagnum ishizawai]
MTGEANQAAPRPWAKVAPPKPLLLKFPAILLSFIASMNPTKTRFAPSPTGLMHIGNARTALFSALYGESFLLRIEDTDAERSRREFVDELLADLRWMGLPWQEGPQTAEPGPDYFQSRRGAVYQRYYDALEQNGLAYPCFCTPRELEISRKIQLSSGQPPRYTGKCAHLNPEEVARKRAEGLEPTLRFKVPKRETVEFLDGVRGPQKFATDDIGDFIIRRADGSAAFFFCNAIDDALMGVTHVLRGEDHLANTPRQLLVLKALDLPAPQYAHNSLILGDDGAPLSKRNGSRSIAQLREEGYFPLALLNMLARLGHHYDSEDIMDFAALKARFDLSRLGKSPARFDIDHLKHWQQLAVRSADPATLKPWLHAETRALVPEDQLAAFLDIVRSNCLFPAEADGWARILFADELKAEPDMAAAARGAGEAFFLAALDAATLAGADFDAFMKALKAKTGAKGKGLFLPLRAALTGRHDGPELGALYRILDPARLHRRLAEFTYESE